MSYRITGLDPTPFSHLWDATNKELEAAGIIRMQANASPGYPDRITLDDAAVGDAVLLLNHVSQAADTPYRATHAIFVREGADTAFDEIDALPPAMARRPQSLRAFGADGMMRTADIAEGRGVEALIARMFDDPMVDEIHAHNARQGCFMARITRA